MGRPLKGQEKGGATPTTQFRLDDDVLTALDEIAAFYTDELGTPQNRTTAVRLAIKQAHDRIRRLKGARGGKR